MADDPAGNAPSHDPYAALRHLNYRLYISGNSISVIGMQMMNMAIGWELYARTKSATALGLVGLMQIVPILALALPAGHVVDRFNRKTIILIDQLLLALSATALGLASLFSDRIPDLAILHQINIWLGHNAYFWGERNYHFTDHHIPLLYALLILNGIIRSINQPAKQSLLPQLVPPPIFPNAVTWNSSLFEICTMIGPLAAGGILTAIDFISPHSPWAYPTIYFLTAACQLTQLFFFLPLKLIPMTRENQPMTLRTLTAGFKFVWDTKILFATISLDMFAVLLGGATALLPMFAKDILHVGPAGLGALRAAPSIGAFLMAMTLAHLPPLKKAGHALLLSVAGFGFFTIIFGISTNFYLSLLCLLLTGACDNISVVVRHTLVQLLTPNQMRGRVSAVNSVFISCSNELGALESGLTAALMGPLLSVVTGGMGTILVVAGVAMLYPQVRRLGKLRDAAPEPVAEPQGFPVELAAANEGGEVKEGAASVQ